MKKAVLLSFLALLGLDLPSAAREFTIPNELRLRWPLEHTYFTVPAAEAPTRPSTMTIQGETRPVQVEFDTEHGKRIARLWTVVTIADENGKPPTSVKATLNTGTAPSSLVVAEQGDHYLIKNGVYAFRLRKYAGALKTPAPLSELPHWIGGMKARSQHDWDGRAWFESSAVVRSARTELICAGPVFADYRVTYAFEGPVDGTTEALPLTSGKQTHTWRPNELPSETIEKREFAYEVLIRFVAGDPWIDVNERFHFPRDPELNAFGVHQYRIQWGEPVGVPAFVPGFAGREHMPVDTVTWVRWFEYDTFGGNTSQSYVPAKPRPAQKGRPFALLRPRWNQGGGGAQDFFLTSGGPPPKRSKKKVDGKTVWVDGPTGDGYNPDNPAVGIVATFASKWVGPYPATIATYAYDGNRGSCRFPMIDGERSGKHYGQRAYAICVGPRRAFRSLNDLVRRHTDWTLAAQMNKYILDWNRGGNVKDVGRLVDAGLFLGRRYQDDFLNPTQRATRNLPALGEARKKAGKQPIGGSSQAALGYIFTDLDHWPGWHNGFTPGNPNFHTDKYMGAVYVAAALPEHPHADEWLAFGISNFEEDLKKVLLEPDGVGYECPGYSGYSLGHQLNLVRTLNDIGVRGILEKHPMIAASGRWHRKLITPFDSRIQKRHEAPHGDTHRWDSGLLNGFGKLAYFYQKIDPDFASEMMGTHKLLTESGADKKKMHLGEWLGTAKLNVRPTKPMGMDWSSQAFDGFGAIMRTGFGTPDETFLSFKAGRARGHYHNDELAFHYYAGGTPISLDYNCSYHPRGDHAALHNSMTFGNTTELKHNASDRAIEAMEEMGATAGVLSFNSTDDIDVVVAERRGHGLSMRPVDPHDNEFGREYPSRKTDPITHRRTLALVKHAERSPLADYLVVLDTATSSEPQQINLHLLARAVEISGSVVHATGQWDKDMVVAFFPIEGPMPRIEERAWHYFDEWMLSPGDEYTLREGESQAAWAERVSKQNPLPAADWEPRWKKGRDDQAAKPWHDLIQRTHSAALIPPPGWNPKMGWMYGEYQKWLRVHTEPGQAIAWALIPYVRGTEAPTVFAVEGGIRVTLGNVTETILIDHDGATVSRN